MFPGLNERELCTIIPQSRALPPSHVLYKAAKRPRWVLGKARRERALRWLQSNPTHAPVNIADAHLLRPMCTHTHTAPEASHRRQVSERGRRGPSERNQPVAGLWAPG